MLFVHADWLARRFLAKYYSPNKWLPVSYKVTLWSASYSACVVYTKTTNTIHLSVSESGGYLPRHFAAQ